MKVTLLELKLGRACKSQRKLFRKTFGRSAEINEENFNKARQAGLDISYYVKYVRVNFLGFSNLKRRQLVRDLAWAVGRVI